MREKKRGGRREEKRKGKKRGEKIIYTLPSHKVIGGKEDVFYKEKTELIIK